MTLKINLLGVPIYYGCDKKGVENGPNSLRENGLLEILRKNNTVYDLGNLYIPHIDEKDKYKNNSKMKYLKEVQDVTSNLSEAVYNILNSNSFPFVVGGDHSIGLGCLNGVSRYFKDDLAVVWVDAHGDINTDITSPSGNIHGMPLAASMGVGHSSLTKAFNDNYKINPKNVYILCARDLDKGELDLIKELNINVWTTKAIKEKGIATVMKEFHSLLNKSNVNNVHLSFDIDCMDKSLVPGTGTPVEDGLNMTECLEILDSLFSSNKIKSMDFVEFNPLIDEDEVTLNNVILLLKHISTLIK